MATRRTALTAIALSVALTCTATVQTRTTAATFAVNTFNEPGAGSVNSYWLATRDGIIVIDTQRTPSAAAKLVREVKAAGKPVIAILITHPHPDHARGLAVLAEEFPGAPIYSSQATLDGMRSDRFDYFPEGAPLPTRVIAAGEVFRIGGVIFRADEIGAGEAEAMTMFYLPAENIVFSSDVISGPRRTPFLVEGRSAAWLKQLDALAPRYKKVKTVYPGHGASGAPQDLITAQKQYLIEFRRLINKELKIAVLSSETKQLIVSEMERRYPGYLPVAVNPPVLETNKQLLELNVDAVAKELSQVRE